jgi:PERQ amino acid-rich with GYF domain-containing protein
MVQQREYVMRAQAMSKFPIPAPMLQHHSSAHSLQSQPSFGSISSPNPIGMAPHQQPIGAMPPSGGFFEGAGPVGSQTSVPSGSGNGDPFRDGDFANTERQLLANLQGSGAPHPIGAPVADASVRAGLPDTESLEQDPEGFKNRLQQFEDLRAGLEAEQAEKAEEGSEEELSEELAPAAEAASEDTQRRAEAPVLTGKAARAAKKKAAEDALSLTQQVQQTQAAAAAAAAQPVEPDMPMPFPPPASTGTPLPAPTAQRARSNLPEQYNRSQTGTPDSASVNAQPPPLAPWAKDHGAESHKGPSLKEIQEAEARKAAKAEEAAAAQRKAILEQELREREKTAAASNAGLPATSTWGHGSPAPAGSPWSKPGPSKTTSTVAPSTPASGKKTLAEIQREEELRKQKASQATPQASTPTGVSKSYANLAGKPGQSILTNAASAAAAAAAATAPPPGSGWATVGAGGKVKVPTGPSSQSRSVSSTNIKPVTSPTKSTSKLVTPGNGKTDTGNAAMEEFNKWVNRELSRGITAVSDIATFQATLEILPLDAGLIADAVYGNSTTMDGRHFAEEFIRRKKLAERGVVEKQPDNKGGNGGGWSEVAKKGGSSNSAAIAASATATSPRDDAGMQAAGFKVVPGRKKGKK